MTPTTTNPSIRDWLIDCAVRWQRRNKLLVPRANATPGADEVAAVIGSRNALRGQLTEPDDQDAIAVTVEAEAMVAEAPAAIAESEPANEAPVEDVVVEAVADPVEDVAADAPAEAPAALEPEATEPVAEVVEAIAPQPEAAPEVAVEIAPEVVEVAPVVLEVTVPAAEAPATEAAAPTRRAADRREPAWGGESSRTTAELDLEKMKPWDVMLLAGPAGSGKSSIAHHFCALLPKAVHIKVEPLRDRAYSVLVARPTGDAQPEVWSGTTEEARQQAVTLAQAYMHTGHHVVIDDVIEAPTELTTYLDGFADKTAHVVTLMPSLDEMERRDRVRDVNQSSAIRVRELHAGMTRQMSQHSTLFDTSHETVVETVQRIIGLVEG